MRWVRLEKGACRLAASFRHIACSASQGIIVVVQLRRSTMPALSLRLHRVLQRPGIRASPVSVHWPQSPDPFLSLESLDDPAVLAWVEQQNARTRAAWCGSVRFETLKQQLAEAYLPRERPVIPIAGKTGPTTCGRTNTIQKASGGAPHGRAGGQVHRRGRTCSTSMRSGRPKARRGSASNSIFSILTATARS